MLSKNFTKFEIQLKQKLTEENFENVIHNIFFMEKLINERRVEYIGVHVRYLTELLIPLMEDYANKYGLKIKDKKNRFSFKYLDKHLDTIESNSKAMLLKELNSIGNDTSHIINMERKSMTIFDEPRINTKPIEYWIDVMKKLHGFLNWVFEENNVFDPLPYMEGEKSWNSYPEVGELKTMENNRCQICEQGHMVRPTREPGKIGLKYGPYLMCDDKNCNAILSVKLKVKKPHFQNCQICRGDAKEVFDFKTQRRFIACNDKLSCGHTTDYETGQTLNIDDLSDFDIYDYI